MGCPTNAKQSMLVTTISRRRSSAERTSLHRARVPRLSIAGGRVVACEAFGVAHNGARVAARVRLRARHFVLAAGAIGSPAILLRSHAPDPDLNLGRRTFASLGRFRRRHAGEGRGLYGAPQSIFSDSSSIRRARVPRASSSSRGRPSDPRRHHPARLWRAPCQLMATLSKLQVVIALVRERVPSRIARRAGGAALDGSPVPTTDVAYLWDAARRAYRAMAEIQFAAGARQVMPVHESAAPLASWADAREAIDRLPMRILAARLVSAHVMGGCAMGPSARSSVVDEAGRHHQLANLSVHDASIFPTSLGANPQLSIYAQAARLSAALASALR